MKIEVSKPEDVKLIPPELRLQALQECFERLLTQQFKITLNLPDGGNDA